MKRFFSKRAVPTLVLIAFSFGALIVGDLVAQCQAAGQWPKGDKSISPKEFKGGQRNVFTEANDTFLTAVEEQRSEADSESRSDLWYFSEFLANAQFNVQTTSYLAERDPKTRRFVPGKESSTFVKDELICLETTSEKDGYLYVFSVGANDDISLLFPAEVRDKDGNVLESFETADNSVKAGEKVAVPKEGVRIRTGAPFGTEMLLTIVTSKKLGSEELRSFVDSSRTSGNSGSSSIAQLSKDLMVEQDVDDRVAPDFEYGVHRHFFYTFETETERLAFLDKPRTFFVGIGVGSFKNGIRSLSSCVNDVNALADVLKEQGAVRDGDVILLTDKDATTGNIKYLFSSFLPAYLKPGDRVIIHWSSHGYTKDKKMYFVSYDSKQFDVDTMVSSDDLNKWASNMKDKKLLFIFDACYSGAAIDPDFDWTKDSRRYEKSLGGDNLSIVASSSPEETSSVRSDNINYSLMTSVVIDYLKAHRNVNAIELGHSIADEVNQLAVAQFKKRQTVFSVQGGNGEFIINPSK